MQNLNAYDVIEKYEVLFSKNQELRHNDENDSTTTTKKNFR